MLTRLIVRNFKRFDEIDIELGSPVVLIGPNNSGKTTALQALALWEIGVRLWNERRRGRKAPEKRPGVTISRRDLFAMPVPDAKLLWRDLHVRDVQRVNGKPQTQNVRIEIVVDGVTEDRAWQCGLEFDYNNEETLYCRPLRVSEEKGALRMPVPEQASRQHIAFLPPMSGLAAVEPKWEAGRINVLVGEGQTAQVLRNLCYRVAQDAKDDWREICTHIRKLFGVELDEPEYVAERGEITMTYSEPSMIRLDLSASGRGLQQTLLLLAYLYINPGAVLLIDEPDAHLEILRQRQIYQLLSDVARQHNSQIVAASHSEVVLNEAGSRDMVVAFVGKKPHRIDDRGSQVLKALSEIGFDQYYQAEETGWVLYLEGSTDLAILRAFARRLGHPAAQHLEKPFVHYVSNQPRKARDHFFGLREAKRNLVAVAIYDHLERELEKPPKLLEAMWERCEIENYVLYPEVLLAYAAASAEKESIGPLFGAAEAETRQRVMRECIADLVAPAYLHNMADRWWSEVKASEVLDRIFEEFFKRLGLPNLMRKSDYHVLAELVPEKLIEREVKEKLDTIVKAADRGHPESA